MLYVVVSIGDKSYRAVLTVHTGVEHFGNRQTCGFGAVDHNGTNTRAVVRHVLKTKFDGYAPAHKQYDSNEDVRVQYGIQHQVLPCRVTDNAVDECRSNTCG